MKISWVHKAHREIVCSAGEGNVGHCLISSRDECWEKHKGCCSQICAKAPHRSDGTVLSCAAVCTVVGLWCCVMDVQKIPVSWLFPKTLYCCIWQGGICGARILDGQISCWQNRILAPQMPGSWTAKSVAGSTLPGLTLQSLSSFPLFPVSE